MMWKDQFEDLSLKDDWGLTKAHKKTNDFLQDFLCFFATQNDSNRGELDNDSGNRGAKEEREILGIITSIQVKISRINH